MKKQKKRVKKEQEALLVTNKQTVQELQAELEQLIGENETLQNQMSEIDQNMQEVQQETIALDGEAT